MDVKVVADSQVLVRYLINPTQLSDPALEALLAAEDSDGVIVSVATLGDLWYASQKTSSAPIAPGVFEHIRDTVLDPSTNLVLQPISVATMMHFDVVPLNDLRDPFDRLILATAVQLGVPLVTADRAMSNTKATEIIW
jgi:PIN domain nuclease of toxin-antitoxin system